MISSFIRSWGFALCLAVLTPITAFAHIGIGHLSGFGAGFSHPFSGVDHILAMVAIGLWATQLGNRAVIFIPAMFVLTMVAGGMLGMLGVSIPFVEQGILASILVLGLLVAAALRLPAEVSIVVAAVFALFHGHAHGTEMAAEFGGLAYAAGFAIATALLHVGGISFGLALNKMHAGSIVRIAGVAIAASGIYLAIA